MFLLGPYSTAIELRIMSTDCSSIDTYCWLFLIGLAMCSPRVFEWAQFSGCLWDHASKLKNITLLPLIYIAKTPRDERVGKEARPFKSVKNNTCRLDIEVSICRRNVVSRCLMLIVNTVMSLSKACRELGRSERECPLTPEEGHRRTLHIAAHSHPRASNANRFWIRTSLGTNRQGTIETMEEDIHLWFSNPTIQFSQSYHPIVQRCIHPRSSRTHS